MNQRERNRRRAERNSEYEWQRRVAASTSEKKGSLAELAEGWCPSSERHARGTARVFLNLFIARYRLSAAYKRHQERLEPAEPDQRPLTRGERAARLAAHAEATDAWNRAERVLAEYRQTLGRDA